MEWKGTRVALLGMVAIAVAAALAIVATVETEAEVCQNCGLRRDVVTCVGCIGFARGPWETPFSRYLGERDTCRHVWGRWPLGLHDVLRAEGERRFQAEPMSGLMRARLKHALLVGTTAEDHAISTQVNLDFINDVVIRWDHVGFIDPEWIRERWGDRLERLPGRLRAD